MTPPLYLAHLLKRYVLQSMPAQQFRGRTTQGRTLSRRGRLLVFILAALLKFNFHIHTNLQQMVLKTQARSLSRPDSDWDPVFLKVAPRHHCCCSKIVLPENALYFYRKQVWLLFFLVNVAVIWSCMCVYVAFFESLLCSTVCTHYLFSISYQMN